MSSPGLGAACPGTPPAGRTPNTGGHETEVHRVRALTSPARQVHPLLTGDIVKRLINIRFFTSRRTHSVRFLGFVFGWWEMRGAPEEMQKEYITYHCCYLLLEWHRQPVLQVLLGLQANVPTSSDSEQSRFWCAG